MRPKPDRRPLRFDRIDEVLADVERLATAEAARGLATSGQWTLGQALNHLATWVNYSYDGVPLRLPLPVRLVMRALKRQILTRPMRPGSRLPGVVGGTLAIDVVPTAASLAHARRSFARLQAASPDRPHPLFGPMTLAEWTALHCRHAELHLSFFSSASGTETGPKSHDLD